MSFAPCGRADLSISALSAPVVSRAPHPITNELLIFHQVIIRLEIIFCSSLVSIQAAQFFSPAIISRSVGFQ